jgi:protein phosphatase
MKVTLPDFCLVVLMDRHGNEARSVMARHFAGEAVDAASDLEAGIATRLASRAGAAVAVSLAAAGTRMALMSLARRHFARAYALVVGETVSLEQLAPELKKEGFHAVHALAPEATAILREPLPMDRRAEAGPFDVIGDVHGCAGELIELIGRLGYRVDLSGSGEARAAEIAAAPAGRRLAFVGDLVDRGPASPDVLRIVMALVEQGLAVAVPGNHDVKFLRWLDGRNVKPTHGLDRTIAQFSAEPDALRHRVHKFLDGLVSHAWLDSGDLVVAHAGIKEHMIGRAAGPVREFCLYGERSGETDSLGLPIRYHWAAEYQGAPAIVYGHTPVPEPEWVNNTLCIDTGCVFGGALTALRWPEREIVSVRARETYFQSLRPFGHPPVRPGAKVRT